MSAGPDLHRLRKEMIDCGRDWDGAGVHACPAGAGDDLTKIAARIRGPKDSPYERGVFQVEVQIPRGYPFEAPKMRFVTRLWHPNVSSQTGAICLDILKNAWSPALTIKTTLLSLQALLSCPEPNDPQDAEVANMYKSDFKKWVSTAAYWTDMYAVEKGSVGVSSGGTSGSVAGAGSSAGTGTGAVAGAGAGAGAGASGAGAVHSAPSGSGAAGAPAPASRAPKESDPRLQALVDMGFARERAVEALRRKGGDVEAAVELLFSGDRKSVV